MKCRASVMCGRILRLRGGINPSVYRFGGWVQFSGATDNEIAVICCRISTSRVLARLDLKQMLWDSTFMSNQYLHHGPWLQACIMGNITTSLVWYLCIKRRTPQEKIISDTLSRIWSLTPFEWVVLPPSNSRSCLLKECSGAMFAFVF